jgi:hypothetical protein
MATSMRLQKRKRADSTLDSITVLTIAKEAVIQASINERYGKPSNIKDNSDKSDIKQSNEAKLKIQLSFGLNESLLLMIMRRLF